MRPPSPYRIKAADNKLYRQIVCVDADCKGYDAALRAWMPTAPS